MTVFAVLILGEKLSRSTVPALAAAFVGLAPVITGAAEWLVLGTRFSALQLTGLALVVGGAVVLARRA